MAIKERAKQYNKGPRKDIMEAILSNGCVTMEALNLVWKDKAANNIHAAKKMEREGVIKKSRIKTQRDPLIKVYSINRYENNKGEFLRFFPPRTHGYFKEYELGISQRVGFESDPFYQKRLALSSDIPVIMNLANIKGGLKDKIDVLIFEEKVEKDIPYYFQAHELKIDLDLQNESRSIGTLINNDDVYMVYNICDHRPKWSGKAERGIIHHFITFIYPRLTGEKFLKSENDIKAIIVGKEEPVGNLILEKDLVKERKYNGIATYLTLPNKLYRAIYYVPYNDFGIKLLKVVKTNGWEQRIKEYYLKEYAPSDPNASVVNDSIDKNGKMVLFFGVPDLERLFNFYRNAKNFDEKERFTIMCFKEQYNFINNIAGEYCNIIVKDIDEYLKTINE